MASSPDLIQWLEALSTGQSTIIAAVAAGILGLVVAFCFLGRGSSQEPKKESSVKASEEEEEDEASSKVEEKKTEPQKKQWKVKNSGKPKKTTLPTHPLLAADFKGHTGAVLSLDFDSTGRYLVSCSEDRTIRLWYMKTLEEKEHKYSRKNIELDHATHIKFSPDGTAVLVFLSVANALQVFKITKQKGSLTVSEPTIDFPKIDSTVISVGIASTGKFVMTCTATGFTIWTLRGEILESVDTKQVPNSCAAVSPCGKFVACSGFTPDVKIWEVEFSKGGDFQQVTRAMELMGHSAAVLSLSFNGDSQRMATASKDGTWKFWNTDVRYKLREDPKLLATGQIPATGSSTTIALAPDSRVVAIAVDFSIFIFSSLSAQLMEKLPDIHGDVISTLCWDPASQYLVSSGGNDRYIRVWHNYPGKWVHLEEMKTELPKANSDAMKRRLQTQIEEIEAILLEVSS